MPEGLFPKEPEISKYVIHQVRKIQYEAAECQEWGQIKVAADLSPFQSYMVKPGSLFQ